MKTKHLFLLAAVLVSLFTAVHTTRAQGTKFIYQGRLSDGGSPANGTYDLTFQLWSLPAGGSQTGSTLTNSPVVISNGLFSVALDFGAVFNGTTYWLQIASRTNGGGSFTDLLPRQELTPTPYAIYAEAAAIADGSVTSTKILDGTILGADIATNTLSSTQLADSIDLGSTSVSGLFNVYRTAANTPAITLTGSGSQISTFGSDGLEQIRLWGPSFGELLLNDTTGNDTTVRLTANSDGGGALWLYHSNNSARVSLSSAAAAGILNLYATNGSLRANLTANTFGSSLTLYQADGGTGVIVDGDYLGAGLVRLYSTNGNTRINLFGQSATGGGEISVNDNTGTETIELLGQASSTTGGQLTLKKDNGQNGILLQGEESDGRGGRLALYNSTGAFRAEIDADDGDDGGAITLYAADGSAGVILDGESGGAGLVSVYNTNGLTRVQLDGYSTGAGGRVSVYDSTGTETIQMIGAEGVTAGGQILMRNAAGGNTIQLDSDANGNGSGYLQLYKSDGTAAITLAADAGGDGRITTQELQITGGSDLSEQFDINSVATELQPGMVVCIDPQHPGELVSSTKAYDRTVAGVISGAGGVKPGMMMGQVGTKADGKHPVALTGRVYVQADSSKGVINPGDLLTTSSTPGHAMKVTNHGKAQGAILGKAMTGLSEGKGLVLVLVSLQ